MEITHVKGYQWGGGEKKIGEKIQGIRSIIGRYKIDRGELKSNVGNGEAKELICTTHGHELSRGKCYMEEGYRAKEEKGEKKMRYL